MPAGDGFGSWRLTASICHRLLGCPSSSRRSLERELEVSSLIAEAWGPQDIAAKDQALRRAEEQGLEQLERHLASRRAEAVPRMRAEVDDMCRAMAGHRAHARH